MKEIGREREKKKTYNPNTEERLSEREKKRKTCNPKHWKKGKFRTTNTEERLCEREKRKLVTPNTGKKKNLRPQTLKKRRRKVEK